MNSPAPTPSGPRPFQWIIGIALVLTVVWVAVVRMSGPEMELLEEDTQWSGQMEIDRVVAVPPGVTLRIAPGAVLLFKSSGGLVVRGRVLAEGSTASRIRFAAHPEASEPWLGMVFEQTTETSRLAFCDLEGAVAGAQAVMAVAADVEFDQVTFMGLRSKAVMGYKASLMFKGCTFADAGPHQVIYAEGVPESGRFQVTQSTFKGGQAAGLVLKDCHGLVADNRFLHFGNPESGPFSPAVSLGGAGGVVFSNNVFAFNVYGVMCRHESRMTAVNNTFYANSLAAIEFRDRTRVSADPSLVNYGLFLENGEAVKVPPGFSALAVSNSVLPVYTAWQDSGNTNAAVRLGHPEAGDFKVVTPGFEHIGAAGLTE